MLNKGLRYFLFLLVFLPLVSSSLIISHTTNNITACTISFSSSSCSESKIHNANLDFYSWRGTDLSSGKIRVKANRKTGNGYSNIKLSCTDWRIKSNNGILNLTFSHSKLIDYTNHSCLRI